VCRGEVLGEKTCPSATRPGLGSNLGHHDVKAPSSNLLAREAPI
jgi:hypothetical protein